MYEHSRDTKSKKAMVRVSLVAVVLLTLLGGYKQLSATAEREREAVEVSGGAFVFSRQRLQAEIDKVAGQLRSICAKEKQNDFVKVDVLLLQLRNELEALRRHGIKAIVKQSNTLLRKIYQCLTASLVYTLTHKLTVQGTTDAERSQFLRTLGYIGDISGIPKKYISELQIAEMNGFPTSNFNLAREEREGIARTMNTEILNAAQAYNEALQAEGGDKLQKFGFELPGARVQRAELVIPELIAPVISPVVGAGLGAQEADEEVFRGWLQQQDPQIYEMYVGLQKQISFYRWSWLYLATFKPKSKELVLGTKDKPAPIDYVFEVSQKAVGVEDDIDYLESDKFGVQERLERALGVARVEAADNVAIWHQAIGLPSAEEEPEEEREETTPIGGAGGIFGAESRPTQVLAPGMVGSLTAEEFSQLLLTATKRLNKLGEAINKARTVIGSTQDVTTIEKEARALESAYSFAHNFIVTLVQHSGGDEQAVELEKESQEGIFKEYNTVHDRMLEIIEEAWHSQQLALGAAEVRRQEERETRARE